MTIGRLTIERLKTLFCKRAIIPVGEKGPNGFEEPVAFGTAIHRDGDERVGVVKGDVSSFFRHPRHVIAFANEVFAKIA